MKAQINLAIPVSIVASIFCLRMLGLFMIMPVFSLYTHQLSGATPALIGIAIGIYGLSQAVLQLPLGMLSDKLGRKPILLAGLAFFVIGSIVAACSHTIYGVILGRFLQGAGAIGSTLIALIADLTSEKNRTKAMAVIGISIGLSFSIAIFLGPILAHAFDVRGMFFLSAALGLIGMLVVQLGIPKCDTTTTESSALPVLFTSVLRDWNLIRLDIGIFIQHAILTASFVIIPVLLKNLNIPHQEQWHVYLPVLLSGFIFSMPMVVMADRYQLTQPLFLLAILAIALAQLGLATLTLERTTLIILLSVFFVGFNFLEACLPSMISKAAPKQAKGTAMGVYSFSQFFGLFCGGAVGGYLYGLQQLNSVFYLCFACACIWLLIAAPKHLPLKLVTRKSILDQIE